MAAVTWPSTLDQDQRSSSSSISFGPISMRHLDREPQREAAAARASGLRIRELRTARCRMEFFDIGAIVYILRKCVWWVPDFTVERYRDVLFQLDGHIREHGMVVAHSTRTRFDAERESR